MTCNTQIKRLNAIWIAKETTAGTLVDPSIFIPFSKAKLVPEIEVSKNTNAYGQIIENYNNNVSKVMSKTEIEWDVLDVSIWYILLGLLSTYTNTDNWDWTHTHKFELQNDNCNDTFSIYEVSKTWNKQAGYSMLDNASINLVSGETIKFKSVYKGKAIVDATNNVTPTYNSVEKEFLASNATIKFWTDLTAAASATPTPLKEINLNINKNVKENTAIHGDTGVISLNNLQTTINWDLTAIMESDDLRQKVLNGTNQAAIIEVEWRTIWSVKAKITININKLTFESWDSSDDLNGLVEETLGFDVAYDSANNQAIEIELINDKNTDY